MPRFYRYPESRRANPPFTFAGVRLNADGRRLYASDAKGTLPPTRPAAPIRIVYQRKLEEAVEEMHRSVSHWITADYRREMALDASAPRVLQAAVGKLSRRWLRNFDKLSGKLSDWFAKKVEERSTRALADALRRGGFTVRFKPTRAMNEAFQAVVGENIALIKSIPEQYLKSVEGAVMRSVQTGRDLGTLVEELTNAYGVTKRRAALIARTQNNQATAVMTRVRQIEAGITKARWLHSAGGKTPRPEHVAFSGKEYDIADGAPVEGGWPGVAINCRCVSVPVIPGFD